MAKEAAKKTEEGGGGSKTKLFIIIAVVAVLLIGVGVGVFLFLRDGGPLTPEQEQALIEQRAREIGPMVNIESFIVNILDDTETRYLKAAITLEAETADVAAEVNLRMPQIRDAILLLVGNKTFSELNDLQGKLQLRAELTNRINGILTKGKIKQIYFTDFVVQ